MKTYKELSESLTDIKAIANTFMNTVVGVNKLEKEIDTKLDVKYKKDFNDIRQIMKKLKDKIQSDPKIRSKSK